MSIILKGIDLPKEQSLMVFIANNGAVACSGEDGVTTTKAIQIPKGHGTIKDIGTFLKNKCLYEYIENDVFNAKYVYLVNTEAIHNAPTILEAEE